MYGLIRLLPHLSTTYLATRKDGMDINPVRVACSAFVPNESFQSMSKRKLRIEQVLEARLRYRAGERELSKLAQRLGVARQALQSAVVGHTFKHLLMPPKRLR